MKNGEEHTGVPTAQFRRRADGIGWRAFIAHRIGAVLRRFGRRAREEHQSPIFDDSETEDAGRRHHGVGVSAIIQMTRCGNNPKRRICGLDRLTMDERIDLAGKVAYVGSGHHKRFPAVYGFGPSASPRPSKSVCDGIKVIPKGEAEQLLRTGVLKGMFSEPLEQGFPTYVWSVDRDGEVYEANTHPNNRGQYHGYRIEEHDPMRGYVLNIWKQRCQPTGQ